MKYSLQQGETQAAIAKRFSCSPAAVSKAIKNLEFEETIGLLYDIINRRGRSKILKRHQGLIYFSLEAFERAFKSLMLLDRMSENWEAEEEGTRKARMLISIEKTRARYVSFLAKNKQLLKILPNLQLLLNATLSAVEKLPVKCQRYFREVLAAEAQIMLKKKKADGLI